MLSFSIVGTSGLCIKSKAGALKIFPESTKKEGDEIILVSTPEEHPGREIISWPGEYDIRGIAIHGVGHREGQQVSYAVEVEGVKCGFLSAPLHEWSEGELEALGDIDVLAVPPENPKAIHTLIEKIDPRILLIPSPPRGSTADVLGACGAQDAEPVEEYKMKSSSLPMEGREVAVLKR